MKYIIKYLIVILTGASLMSCNTFAGFLFPKKRFSFHPIYEQIPSSSKERLNAASTYPQNFTFSFSQAGNSFITYFIPTIFVNRPYESLQIKEMKYEWNDNIGIFLSEVNFKIPISSYSSKDNWYWIRGIGDFYNINFEKLFIDKKPGDEFLFKLIIIYSFDDNIELTQVIEYNVTTIKGKYISPFS